MPGLRWIAFECPPLDWHSHTPLAWTALFQWTSLKYSTKSLLHVCWNTHPRVGKRNQIWHQTWVIHFGQCSGLTSGTCMYHTMVNRFVWRCCHAMFKIEKRLPCFSIVPLYTVTWLNNINFSLPIHGALIIITLQQLIIINEKFSHTQPKI